MRIKGSKACKCSKCKKIIFWYIPVKTIVGTEIRPDRIDLRNDKINGEWYCGKCSACDRLHQKGE